VRWKPKRSTRAASQAAPYRRPSHHIIKAPETLPTVTSVAVSTSVPPDRAAMKARRAATMSPGMSGMSPSATAVRKIRR
jgi:hypothetical protein